MTGCGHRSGARQLSGTYVHQESGGKIIFQPNGQFYYSFIAPTNSLPRNLGYYHFEDTLDTEPHLSVRSAHAGLFRIKVLESGNRVLLTHPSLFPAPQVYEKTL